MKSTSALTGWLEMCTLAETDIGLRIKWSYVWIKMTIEVSVFPTCRVFVGGGCRRRLDTSPSLPPCPGWPERGLRETPAWREETASSRPGQTPSLEGSHRFVQYNKFTFILFTSITAALCCFYFRIVDLPDWAMAWWILSLSARFPMMRTMFLWIFRESLRSW